MHRVCIVSSGHWGSSIAKLIGENIQRDDLSSEFDSTVRLYVGSDTINGASLSDVINTQREDTKYSPGVALPANVRAYSDIRAASEGADYLVFASESAALPPLLCAMKDSIASGASGINVVKGVTLRDDSIELIPEVVERVLGVPCGGLSGAITAASIARGQLTEATIAFQELSIARAWQRLLSSSFLHCRAISDVYFQQLLGTLTGVIALGADFVDGLGFGENTKAAVLRIGLKEMYKFAHWYYPDKNVDSLTLLESCGISDLIATAYTESNRRCAIEFVRTGKDWGSIEADVLAGEQLRAAAEARGVYDLLERRRSTEMFPLMSKICKISRREEPVADIFQLQKAM